MILAPVWCDRWSVLVTMMQIRSHLPTPSTNNCFLHQRRSSLGTSSLIALDNQKKVFKFIKCYTLQKECSNTRNFYRQTSVFLKIPSETKKISLYLIVQHLFLSNFPGENLLADWSWLSWHLRPEDYVSWWWSVAAEDQCWWIRLVASCQDWSLLRHWRWQLSWSLGLWHW